MPVKIEELIGCGEVSDAWTLNGPRETNNNWRPSNYPPLRGRGGPLARTFTVAETRRLMRLVVKKGSDEKQVEPTSREGGEGDGGMQTRDTVSSRRAESEEPTLEHSQAQERPSRDEDSSPVLSDEVFIAEEPRRKMVDNVDNGRRGREVPNGLNCVLERNSVEPGIRNNQRDSLLNSSLTSSSMRSSEVGKGKRHAKRSKGPKLLNRRLRRDSDDDSSGFFPFPLASRDETTKPEDKTSARNGKKNNIDCLPGSRECIPSVGAPPLVHRGLSAPRPSQRPPSFVPENGRDLNGFGSESSNLTVPLIAEKPLPSERRLKKPEIRRGIPLGIPLRSSTPQLQQNAEEDSVQAFAFVQEDKRKNPTGRFEGSQNTTAEELFCIDRAGDFDKVEGPREAQVNKGLGVATSAVPGNFPRNGFRPSTLPKKIDSFFKSAEVFSQRTNVYETVTPPTPSMSYAQPAGSRTSSAASSYCEVSRGGGAKKGGLGMFKISRPAVSISSGTLSRQTSFTSIVSEVKEEEVSQRASWDYEAHEKIPTSSVSSSDTVTVALKDEESSLAAEFHEKVSLPNGRHQTPPREYQVVNVAPGKVAEVNKDAASTVLPVDCIVSELRPIVMVTEEEETNSDQEFLENCPPPPDIYLVEEDDINIRRPSFVTGERKEEARDSPVENGGLTSEDLLWTHVEGEAEFPMNDNDFRPSGRIYKATRPSHENSRAVMLKWREMFERFLGEFAYEMQKLNEVCPVFALSKLEEYLQAITQGTLSLASFGFKSPTEVFENEYVIVAKGARHRKKRVWVRVNPVLVEAYVCHLRDGIAVDLYNQLRRADGAESMKALETTLMVGDGCVRFSGTEVRPKILKQIVEKYPEVFKVVKQRKSGQIRDHIALDTSTYNTLMKFRDEDKTITRATVRVSSGYCDTW